MGHVMSHRHRAGPAFAGGEQESQTPQNRRKFGELDAAGRVLANFQSSYSQASGGAKMTDKQLDSEMWICLGVFLRHSPRTRLTRGQWVLA